MPRIIRLPPLKVRDSEPAKPVPTFPRPPLQGPPVHVHVHRATNPSSHTIQVTVPPAPPPVVHMNVPLAPVPVVHMNVAPAPPPVVHMNVSPTPPPVVHVLPAPGPTAVGSPVTHVHNVHNARIPSAVTVALLMSLASTLGAWGGRQTCHCTCNSTIPVEQSVNQTHQHTHTHTHLHNDPHTHYDPHLHLGLPTGLGPIGLLPWGSLATKAAGLWWRPPRSPEPGTGPLPPWLDVTPNAVRLGAAITQPFLNITRWVPP